MASSIDAQIIKTWEPTAALDGTGAFAAEVKNQQLNTALAAGTVDTILMKSGYDPTLAYNVICLKHIAQFLTKEQILELIIGTTLDFGFYNGRPIAQRLNIITNKDPEFSGNIVPRIDDFKGHPDGQAGGAYVGELMVNNSDCGVWSTRYKPYLHPNGFTESNSYPKASKIDAGSVNGVYIDGDTFTNSDDIKMMIMNAVNASYSYNSTTNALTIKKITLNDIKV